MGILLSLVLIAGGKAAHLQAGSYCLRSGNTQTCTSVAYDPHPQPVFRVAGGSTIAMCAGRPARRVRVALLHSGRRGSTLVSARRARRLDDAGQCWRSKLPRRLGSANSVEVHVFYRSRGDVDFIAGLAGP